MDIISPASLLSAFTNAEKSDAGDMISMLDENEQNLNSFSHIYPDILQGYLDRYEKSYSDFVHSQSLTGFERFTPSLKRARCTTGISIRSADNLQAI